VRVSARIGRKPLGDSQTREEFAAHVPALLEETRRDLGTSACTEVGEAVPVRAQVGRKQAGDSKTAEELAPFYEMLLQEIRRSPEYQAVMSQHRSRVGLKPPCDSQTLEKLAPVLERLKRQIPELQPPGSGPPARVVEYEHVTVRVFLQGLGGREIYVRRFQTPAEAAAWLAGFPGETGQGE
jgi:hypothetical protein